MVTTDQAVTRTCRDCSTPFEIDAAEQRLNARP
jgi:hypothetical protein